LTSARIEVRGFEAIQLMGDAIAMVHQATVSGQPVDETSFKDALSRLSLVIDDLNKILWAVRDACGYQFFYWAFRPVSEGPLASTNAYTKQLPSGFGAPIKVMVRRNGFTRGLMAKAPSSNVLAPQQARPPSCMHSMVRQLPLYPAYPHSYITSFSLSRHWPPSEGRPIFAIMHRHACASIV
jgi:transposase